MRSAWRRGGVPVSAALSRTCALGPLASETRAQRGFRVLPERTTDRHQASATDVLGLDPHLAVDEESVRRAFVREAKKLARVDRPGRRKAVLAAAVNDEHDADVASQAQGMKPASAEQQRQRRVQAITSAYAALRKDAGKRARHAQVFVPTSDGALGLTKSESPFANHDPRHQKFVFEDPLTRPIDDSSRASHRLARGVDHGQAMAKAGDAPEAGSTVDVRLALSFHEAHRGCTKTVTYARRGKCVACDGTGDARSSARRCTACSGRGQLQLPSASYVIKRECGSCNGSGRRPVPLCKQCMGTGVVAQDEETATVTVNPGGLDGTAIRIKGGGDCGRRGGRTGDLIVTLAVGVHRVLHRVQDDFHIAVPVPLSVALLGGRVRVPSADGETIEVAVPPGSTPGTIISLPDRGAPRRGVAGAFGDLRVHVIVAVPPTSVLTKRQRAAMLQFQETEEALPLNAAVLAAAKQQFGHMLPRRDDGPLP